jgi:hypothetical protein
MRKIVTAGNGNELCGEGGMGMAEHWQNTGNGNGLCGEGNGNGTTRNDSLPLTVLISSRD